MKAKQDAASSCSSSSSIAMDDQKPSATSPKSVLGRLRRKLSPRKRENPSLSTDSEASKHCSDLQRVFDYFDEDGDGKISPAELESCVRTSGGNLSMDDAEAAVSSSDLNGDGLLDFEEFQKLMEASRDEEKNEELRLAFGMYEMEGIRTNEFTVNNPNFNVWGSGCITPTSLKRMLGRLGDSKSIEDCKAMIRKFDLNGDGVLSFEEFSHMMR